MSLTLQIRPHSTPPHSPATRAQDIRFRGIWSGDIRFFFSVPFYIYVFSFMTQPELLTPLRRATGGYFNVNYVTKVVVFFTVFGAHRSYEWARATTHNTWCLSVSATSLCFCSRIDIHSHGGGRGGSYRLLLPINMFARGGGAVAKDGHVPRIRIANDALQFEKVHRKWSG